MRADPGIGREAAPIGTEAWAQYVRLNLQSIIHDLPKAPERAQRYFALIQKHRAWTLMNKPDGGYFSTFDEFCAHKEPWGLGKSYEEIRPFLEAAIGKPGLDLMTVAPDARRENGANQHSGPREESGNDCPNPKNDRTDKNLRAILRAPEPIQNLYREGLIGQVDAARLGKKDPEPEQAARAVEVAREAVALVAAKKPATKREREATKREVNALVRAKVAPAKAPALTTPTPGFERVWSDILKLSREDRATIHQRLVNYIRTEAA